MKFSNSVLLGSLLTIMTLSSATAEDTTTRLEIINPPQLWDPAPFGFSHAVIASDGSKVAYLAGQGADTGIGTFSASMEEQIIQAFANLHLTIRSVGAKPSQVAKITTYLVGYDQSMLEPLAKEVKRIFGSHLPAQTLVPVPRLAIDGMLFEVEAIVILD